MHTQREYGLDLYRIMAMLMITVLHVNGCHLNMMNPELPKPLFCLGFFLEHTCWCGVDCFALLSGYLIGNQRFSSYNSQWLFKFADFWMKMALWGLILSLIWKLFYPGSFVDLLKVVFKSIFPCIGYWWYVSAYMGLLLFLPILTKALQNFNKKEFATISIVLFIFLSCLYSGLTSILYGGYCTLWLIVCFIWGNSLSRWTDDILKYAWIRKSLLPGIFLCILIPFCFTLWGPFRCDKLFFSYISPLCVLEALLLLLLFRCVKIGSTKIQKLVMFFSSNTLGIYLFQCHPLVWKNFIYSQTSPTYPVAQYPIRLIVITGLLALIGIVLNWVIMRIYYFCRIPDLLHWGIAKIARTIPHTEP